MNESGSITGVVEGDVIRLEQATGLPDGQRVTIVLRPVETLPTMEGMQKAFGAWADDAESVDAFLQWNRQQRKAGRPGVSL